MFEKLKQYKDLRNQAKIIQDRLKEIIVHADADGGKIQVVMDGNQNLLGIEIDPGHLRSENRDQLQKHIAEAVNTAVKKSQMEMAQAMKNMKGLNFPGMAS